jgi:hypothetical protein
MDTNKLFSKVYEALKGKDVLVHEAKSCWGEHRYDTKLPNGVVVTRHVQDEGYTSVLSVKGFLYVSQRYGVKDLVFNKGDEKALLTIAKMLGVEKEPTLHDLVIEYHDCNCKWNHTDGCSWHYEINRGVHDWSGKGSAHAEWLEKYLKEVRPLTEAK